jgi:hypothetical protein
MPEEPARSEETGFRQDPTFKRHGPEPPENDSGPSPSEAGPQSRRDERANIPRRFRSHQKRK